MEIINAVQQGNLIELRRAINNGGNVNGVLDQNQNTPLHFAVEKGHLAMVRVLLTAGANVNAQNQNEDTPLIISVITDAIDIAIVRELINGGANLELANQLNQRPLYLSVSEGDQPPSLEVTQLLIDSGANLAAQNLSGTALHIAVLNSYEQVDPSNPVVVQMLIEAGADVNALNHGGTTPLHNAVFQSHAEIPIVRTLINAGADVNAVNSRRGTPLHDAANTSSLEVVQTLINAGANVNALDDEQSNPLHIAAQDSITSPVSIEIIKLLVQSGTDINAVDHQGNTPLDIMARSQRERVVDYVTEIRTGQRLKEVLQGLEGGRNNEALDAVATALDIVSSEYFGQTPTNIEPAEQEQPEQNQGRFDNMMRPQNQNQIGPNNNREAGNVRMREQDQNQNENPRNVRPRRN